MKNHTNEILRQVHRGQPVAVTRRGKPYAALLPLTAEAEADVKAGRLVSWDSFLGHERKRSAA